MSPAALYFHRTLSLATVAGVIGSLATLPPRVLHTFWPYIAQSPASPFEQSSDGTTAAAEESSDGTTAAAEEDASSPVPQPIVNPTTSKTGNARALRQFIGVAF